MALSSVLFFGPRAERPASAASVAAASILEPERRVAYFSPAPGSRDATRPATVAARFAASGLPLVEDADPASDLVMQIEDEDLSLVVVLTGQDV